MGGLNILTVPDSEFKKLRLPGFITSIRRRVGIETCDLKFVFTDLELLAEGFGVELSEAEKGLAEVVQASVKALHALASYGIHCTDAPTKKEEG